MQFSEPLAEGMAGIVSAFKPLIDLGENSDYKHQYIATENFVDARFNNTCFGRLVHDLV